MEPPGHHSPDTTELFMLYLYVMYGRLKESDTYVHQTATCIQSAKIAQQLLNLHLLMALRTFPWAHQSFGPVKNVAIMSGPK